MSDHAGHSGTADTAPDARAIEALLDRIERSVAAISRGFERWDERGARGPGLYFLVVRDPPTVPWQEMGTNRWPVADCATVFDGAAAFLEAAGTVATGADGAVVVHLDGTIEEAMVRVAQLTPAERGCTDDVDYAGWMGARHMSALETSTRPGVAAAITLSEEDGRVTVFTDGSYVDTPASSLVIS